jgi:NosR/NirI family nitrous oxide reductase transcriptional regulator
MRILATIALLAIGGAVLGFGQSAGDTKLESQLRRLFPSATSFSPKGGEPPHIRALVKDASSGDERLIGLAFWTTELAPLERGYDGPIKVLVGMDTKGLLTGVIVDAHREPFGYFSVDLPKFSAQFAGKNIRDRFRYGEDIDSISRATISVTSASRAVRNSARRVARALLAPPD